MLMSTPTVSQTASTEAGSPKLLTADQVASRLGIKKGTVYSMTHRGILPKPLKFSRRMARWEEKDIEALLEKYRQKREAS
jgi:excisionase family DNA binding protein